MQLLPTTEHGDWLLARVGEWGRAGGVAGTGFEAYARILHPPEAWREATGERARRSWADLARRRGRTLHPLVQWRSLTDAEEECPLADGWAVSPPAEGQLAPDLLALLAAHLRTATRTPDEITAGVWTGWGELHVESGAILLFLPDGLSPEEEARQRAEAEQAWREERRRAVAPDVQRLIDDGPFFDWPGRPMLLLNTALTELAEPDWPDRAALAGIMPQLLWPADHCWVMASEIDWDSTIVAGPRALIDRILADDSWEAFEVNADADLTWDGDTVNPRRAP